MLATPEKQRFLDNPNKKLLSATPVVQRGNSYEFAAYGPLTPSGDVLWQDVKQGQSIIKAPISQTITDQHKKDKVLMRHTPSRIPRPVFHSAEKDLKSKAKIPVDDEGSKSTETVNPVMEEKEIKVMIPAPADESDKNALLELIRKRKQELVEKLQGTLNKKEDAAQQETAPESVPQPKPAEPISSRRLTRSATVPKQETTKPKRFDPNSVILSNLSNLSLHELDKLTKINTDKNAKYMKPVQFKVIRKKGPKPPSPNAKTLSKLAKASQKSNAKENFDLEELKQRKLKWADFEDVKEDGTSKRSEGEDLKPCIKKAEDSKKSFLEITKSPILIKRFVYDSVAAAPNITAPGPKAPARRSSLIKRK
jgi:hypothetical protein